MKSIYLDSRSSNLVVKLKESAEKVKKCPSPRILMGGGTIIQLLIDQEPEVKTSHPASAGLVLDAQKSGCYTGTIDGELSQLFMSLSPSVMKRKHPDLWASRVAWLATTFIS